MTSLAAVSKQFDAIFSVVPLAEGADDDRWARVRMVSAAIPPDCDLDDESDVTRALFAARFCCADFADVLTEAIAIARDRRAERE